MAKSDDECNICHRRDIGEVSRKDRSHAINVTVVRNILKLKLHQLIRTEMEPPLQVCWRPGVATTSFPHPTPIADWNKI